MTKKKIMFFDIDGTLIGFNNHGKMTPKMISALHQLKAKGIYIGLATGRQTTVYERIFKELTPLDFVIGSNGREVVIHNQTIYRDEITKETIEKLIRYDNQYHVGLLLSSNYGSATYNPPIEKCAYYLQQLALPTPQQDKDFYLNQTILQAMIYCDEQTEQMFQKAFPELNFIRHNHDGIDVVTSGPLKERGIDEVLQYYGLTKADALAFGDGLNDVGMFQHIDGVCLGVAHPELKKYAIKQIDTVENDGIYTFLKDENYI